MENPQRVVHVMGGHDERHPDPAVERAEHLAVLDAARLADPADDRRHRPVPAVEPRAQPRGQDSPDVEGEPAAGDVRESLDRDLLHRPEHGLDVDSGGGHQALPQRHAAVERSGEGSSRHLEDLAYEREAVRVQAARCESDDAIPGVDPRPVHDAVLLDEPEAESGEIEVLVRIDSRHLGAFSADERCAGELASPGDSLDHDLGRRQLEPAHGQIVQEQDRLRALDEHVVGAHRHQVDSDRLVARGLDGQPELGADSVRRGDEHRVAVPIHRELEERRESAHPAEHPGPIRAARDGPDPVDEPVAPVDVDAGVAITEGGRARIAHVALHPVQPSSRLL